MISVLATIGYLHPLYIVIGMFAMVVTLFVAATVWLKRKVKLFRRYARVEGSRFVLPEEAVVELGDIVLKGYWVETTAGLSYKFETLVLNSEVTRLRAIDLNKLCSRPFFLFAEKSGALIVDAPGLKMNSGKFKDMTVVCLEQSSIPEKSVELEAGDPAEHGKARVRVSPRGVDVEVLWVFKAPVQRKVVYDRERGVYSVVEEYTAKPRARGVRVELCVQTPSRKYCTTLAKVEEPNKPIKTSLPVEVRDRLLYFHTKAGGSPYYSLIRKAVKSESEIVVAGYKPGYMTVRVVLDKPVGADIVNEVPL